MSLLISVESELLKTKRTVSFWLSVLAAGFIPAIFFIAYTLKPEGAYKQLEAQPWGTHFMFGWQALSNFLFPMYVILICALITHIEFKNNAWKQVYASPQSVAQIYFSKFITIHLMILFFFILFNLFMIMSGVIVDLIHPRFTFLEKAIPWEKLLKLSLKTYVSILGITAIQYWLSLRSKNFVAPVGIGLALLIASIVASAFKWEHIFKIPFAHPGLTLKYMPIPNRPFFENHEINSIICFIVFLMIGFIDMNYKKEKG